MGPMGERPNKFPSGLRIAIGCAPINQRAAIVGVELADL